MLRFLVNLFSVPSHSPELIKAQVQAFSKQMPILYSVLVCNMLFVAATNFSTAPIALTIAVPLIGIAIMSVRLISWWRFRSTEHPLQHSIRKLRSTIWLAAAIGVSFTAWSLALYAYGHMEQKAHVVFFMGITMIGCIFSLMHLRAASILVAAIVIVPFTAVLFLSGSIYMYAIAANMLLVTGVILYMTNTYYNDFVTTVSQRIDLVRTHERTLELNASNHRMANHDSLTGLPNRRRFFEKIESLGKGRSDGNPTFAIGLLDLDGFKTVNDLYGHACGDRLLMEAAARMQQLVSDKIFIARLGGDEFGFLVEGGQKEAVTFANAVCAAMRVPFELEDTTVEVAASCGITCYEPSLEGAQHMMECADYALYQSKSLHTGKPIVFSSQHRSAMRESHVINQLLRGANIAAELSLDYQPIVCAQKGTAESFEALARWNSPTLGKVPPSKFITAAEASPLINRITVILLRRMLSDLAAWPRHIRASLNLSARNLSSPDTMLQIVAAIQMSKVDPRRIDFEVTETALMIDFESALRSLTLLRNLGCGISLDDFGTGHSSLSYINELPLDKIKIDRSFVLAVGTNTKTREIVETISILAKKLGLACVAEGVETAEQAELMRACGCTLLQGYYFAKPAQANLIPATSENQRRRPRA